MIWIALINPFFIIFVFLPPFLLILRHFDKIEFSGWAIFLVFVVTGWIFVNLGIYFYYEMLEGLINTTPNPPQKWFDTLNEDGAKRVFALYFGWIYAVIYFLLWYLAVANVPNLLNHAKKSCRPDS